MRLARFLNWTGTETRVFNAGNHRRRTETGVQDAAYFDPASETACARRERIAMETLDEVLEWLKGDAVRFAIFDATNTTKARRKAVAERIACAGQSDLGVIFVESICTDADVLEANLMMKLSKSPDYASTSLDIARQDLMQRVKNYETVYESIDDEGIVVAGVVLDISYIKLVNLSCHVIAHNIWGRAATLVLPYLMALHVGSRPIWLVRLPHTEVTALQWRKAGKAWPPPQDVRFSDQSLSSRGAVFADAVARFALREADNIAVFSCTHRRGLEVAQRFGGQYRIRSALNPQDRGACDGLSREDLQKQAPEVWADPLHCRFLGGESLADMVQRLYPVLVEIEQEMRPVLIVAPLSALKVIYCFFAQQPVRETLVAPDWPLHTVVELRPNGGNFSERILSAPDLLA